MMNTIDTGRLLLRPFTLDDAQAWLPLISEPEIIRFTGDLPVASVDEARDVLLARPLRDYRVHGYGRMAVIEKASGRLVGFSGLKFVEELGAPDIGYRFLPDCWGQGYATESARPLIEHGRRVHGLKRIFGIAHPANAASIRVLEKLGMRYQKLLARHGQTARYRLYATPGEE